jgi:hypothetical protein
MRARNKRYGFFDLHPGVCLAPVAAVTAFLAYENFSTLSTARSSVGGPWLVSALIGAVCGLVALAACVARARAGKPLLAMIGPVILIVLGLLVNKQELWLTSVHPGQVTTAFQSASVAFGGVVATGLVAGFCWLYARLLFRVGAENRKAARIPYRALHISRAENWEAASGHPIGRNEWEVFAGAHRDLEYYDSHSDRAREEAIVHTMTSQGVARERAIELQLRSGEAAAQLDRLAVQRPDLAAKMPAHFPQYADGPGPAPLHALGRPDGTRLLLQWRKEQVSVLRVGPDTAADAALVAPIARELDARVYDEDGTRYG